MERFNALYFLLSSFFTFFCIFIWWLIQNTVYLYYTKTEKQRDMNNTKYITVIEGNKVVIEKVYRTRTQYEFFLKIYMGDSNFESIHIYKECHLTKKSAINEAIKAISRKPRIERVY